MALLFTLTRTCRCCLHEVEAHALWYSFHNGGALQQTGWGEELLNKVIILVFFAHKTYSCSFVKLQSNPWCYMDNFIDVLTMFLDLGTFQLYCCLCRDSKLSDFIKNIRIWCFEDEWRSCGFGTKRGWLINDNIFIFWENYPFKEGVCVYIYSLYVCHTFQDSGKKAGTSK